MKHIQLSLSDLDEYFCFQFDPEPENWEKIVILFENGRVIDSESGEIYLPVEGKGWDYEGDVLRMTLKKLSGTGLISYSEIARQIGMNSSLLLQFVNFDKPAFKWRNDIKKFIKTAYNTYKRLSEEMEQALQNEEEKEWIFFIFIDKKSNKVLTLLLFMLIFNLSIKK